MIANIAGNGRRETFSNLPNLSAADLIAIGGGGRADPLRYFLHPLCIGAMGDTLLGESWRKHSWIT